MEPWERLDKFRDDVRGDDLMSGVPRYEHRYAELVREGVNLMGLALDLALDRLNTLMGFTEHKPWCSLTHQGLNCTCGLKEARG
jgi:hypothetical protein